jgi:hypothetical protein
MKKIFGAMFALAFGVAGVSGTALATPAGLTDTGIVTLTPSDPHVPNLLHIAATVIGLSSPLGLNENVDYIGRMADGFSFINSLLNPNLAGASLSGTGLDGKDGTWTFISGSSVYEIVAVEIDAGFIGSSGHLYLTDAASIIGNWDTSDFGFGRFHPDLNYLDFYGVKVGHNDVPEPMSLMLLGGGLAGLGFARRKKHA